MIDWVGIVLGVTVMVAFGTLAAAFELLGQTLEKKRQGECGDGTP